jgi:hypothetical protein
VKEDSQKTMAFETEMIKLLKENNNLNTKIKERDD